MRDYDETIDTIERWGEEMMAHILETGKVDDWSGTPECNEKSLRRTIGQQGAEIESLMTESDDLKSENNQLQTQLRKQSWLSILFGSIAILLIAGMLIW